MKHKTKSDSDGGQSRLTDGNGWGFTTTRKFVTIPFANIIAQRTLNAWNEILEGVEAHPKTQFTEKEMKCFFNSITASDSKRLDEIADWIDGKRETSFDAWGMDEIAVKMRDGGAKHFAWALRRLSEKVARDEDRQRRGVTFQGIKIKTRSVEDGKDKTKEMGAGENSRNDN